VRCRDATAIFVAKVRVEVFVHFHAVAAKRRSSMLDPLETKENDDHALDFLFTCFAFSGVGDFSSFALGGCYFA
jgi:hypothetical protein